MVGSRPGGSRIMAVTTLSFLPCARLAGGDIAKAVTAASTDNFFNMRILLKPVLTTNRPEIPRNGLFALRRHGRQRHDRLRVVAGRNMNGTNGAKHRCDLATMRVGIGTAAGIGAPCRSDRLRRNCLR